MNEEIQAIIRKAFGQKAITDEEFDKKLTEEVARSKKLVNTNNYEQIMPKLVVLLRKKFNDPLVLLPAFFADLPDKNRREMFLGLGAKMFDQIHKDHLSPVAAFWTYEAWGSGWSEEKEKRLQEGAHVEDFDDKTEVFIVTGMTLDRRTNQAMTKISHLGKFIHLGKTKFMYLKDVEKYKASFDTRLIISFFQGWRMAMEAHLEAQKK